MRGYAVTFDRNRLVLGKIEKGNRQEMATFDLTNPKTKTRINEWSMIRPAAEGPRIRVWLNRMHPSSDPDRGLRIDSTGEKEPVLSAAIGVRAHHVPAWFDNIVVLPVHALPQSCSGRITDESRQYIACNDWLGHDRLRCRSCSGGADTCRQR